MNMLIFGEDWQFDSGGNDTQDELVVDKLTVTPDFPYPPQPRNF